MQHYDLIVVGAGPAGSTAAAAAARAGMRVLLLEKQPLPRHKTCGGGVPMVVGSVLPDIVPQAFVEADVRYMRHTWRFGEPVLAAINAPDADPPLSLWMVRRSVFDQALAVRAAQAGAVLCDGVGVRSVEAGRDGVTVRGGRADRSGTFEASATHVIGADGANGVTARCAGLRRSRPLAIAMEVEHPHPWGAGSPDLRPDVIHLDYGVVDGGYAWVFPKGDHLNVGAGIFRPYSAQHKRSAIGDYLQGVIEGYLAALGVPFQRDRAVFHAHPVPVWGGREAVSTRDGRVMLVGDAAGLVNPLFGDGILHAVRSGNLAVAAITGGQTRGYSRMVHAEFAPGFDAALRLSAFFYRFPRLCYRYGVSRDGATRTAARVLCGEVPLTDLARRALRRLRRALARSAAEEGPPLAG